MSATFAAQTGQQSPSLPSSMSSSYLSDKDAPYTSSSPQEKQLLQPLQQQQQQQQQSQPQHKQPRYYKDNKASISNSHDDNNSNSSVDNDHDSDNSDDDDDDDDDQPAFSHEFDTAPTAAAAAAATTTTTMTAAALRTSSGSNHNAAAARVSGSSSSSASSNNGSNTNNNVGATINKMRPHTTKAAAGGGGGWGSSHANNNNNNSNNNNASSSVSVNAATAAATTATAAPHSSTSLPSSSSSSPQQQQPRSAPRAAPAVTTSSLSARHADANSTADIVQRAKAFVRSDTAPSTAAAAHAEPRRGSDAASGHAYAAGRVPLRAAAAAATTSSQLLASHANNNSSSSSSGYTGDSALASTTTTTLPSNSNAAVAAAAAATSSRVLAAPAWVDAMALSHLLCEYCHHVVSDPVQCFPGPRLLCRRCAAQLQATGAHATAHELPAALVRVVHEVLERARLLRGDWPLPPHKASATTSTSNGEEAVAQRRRAAPTARADAAVDKHNNNKTAATSSSTSGAPASRERVAAPQSPSSPPPPPPAPSAATATATTTAVAPSSLPLRVLEPLAEAEASERGQIATQHQRGFAELERHARRARAAASGPTSRQLKIEADRLYEATHYDRALDYYTRAIALQRDDQQAQLPALYGNRSAANFMAHRYAECVADCLAVVELDHDNVKMYSRAARAAATMGDLAQAVAILEKAIATTTSSSSSSAAAAQQQQGSSSKHVNLASELAKYKQGLELLQKATQQFGSAEGDVHLRMLIAQFADTVPFRVRYAESLMQQRQHLRAYDVLDAVAPSSRPPSVTRRMAECLYLSGFEHFERARRLLSDDAAAANDAGCARLLQVLDRVDEGKQSGNNNFAQKRFSAAVDNYTAAIGHATGNDQILRILYCNRAAANKEIGRYREGIDDCTRALAIDPDFFKAYARRARCHQHLGDHYAAVQDFKKALQYEAGDSELARELRSAEYHLAKEAEREKDYYYQLGLTRAASEREVKVRYRELSLRWHPDKCVNLPDAEKARAEHKFKVISEAYAVLSDPVKRRDFDRKYDLERYARNGLMSGATSMASGGMGGGGGGAASYTTSGVGSDMYRATGAHARHRSGPGGLW